LAQPSHSIQFSTFLYNTGRPICQGKNHKNFRGKPADKSAFTKVPAGQVGGLNTVEIAALRSQCPPRQRQSRAGEQQAATASQ
jgi:hypothetical protein